MVELSVWLSARGLKPIELMALLVNEFLASGAGDRYFTEDRMVHSAEHVTGPRRYARIEGASHWMQLDAPERVNDLLREFLVESEFPVFPRTSSRIDR
jgi:hypothetical protein